VANTSSKADAVELLPSYMRQTETDGLNNLSWMKSGRWMLC